MKNLLSEKIAGCLVGAAYGDALGAPTENRTREQILEKWGYVDQLYDAPMDVYARGNKAGVQAEFSVGKEKLAFPVRKEWEEIDDFTVYPLPDVNVIQALKENETREELWNNLPDTLEYN